MTFFNNNLMKTAFGELATAGLYPVSQMAANYGNSPKAFEFASGAGSTYTEDGLFVAETGAATDSLATVLTSRQMLYRPGQGSLARYTALYDTPAAGSQQYAGFITATDTFAIGYDGTAFGILHAFRGTLEIQELTITTPAAGAENATITVGGTGYTVPLTAGTVQHNAYEISQSLNSQVAGFSFTSNNDQVVAMKIESESTGAFAFTSGTAVASWSLIETGSSPTEDWIPQASWNEDTFPALDPAKGNVFQIRMQYLGFGAVEFEAEDPESGDFFLLHRIKYANKNILPSITNPTLRAGWLVRNTTNATSLKLKGASVGIFNEGEIVITNEPNGLSNSAAGIGATQTNVLTIRNRLVFGTQRNRAEIVPLSLSAFTDSAKGAVLEIRKNATISGDLDYSYEDKATSITEITTDAGTVTGGERLATLSVGSTGFPIDLKRLGIRLFPNETLTISMAVVSGAAADMTAALTLVEDI